MDKKKRLDQAQVSKIVEGLTPVDPNKIAGFVNRMNKKVIPEILDVVEERRLRAAESRELQLKY